MAALLILVEAQGGEERSEYGRGLVKELSVRRTRDYGKGFDSTNLWHMRNSYLSFPILDAMRPQLSWTHCRMLTKVKDVKKRKRPR
ncbi:DUF1016 N-terminal domain-containing protein [Adlercreutzia sp. ZJ138]|uniref:DUF1016 N-terminal domain-containing protein n=1 Tax=Adlercreutzia sp. ZJ138 TaxID=2709405 RepID=UPI0013E9F852